MSKQRSTLSTLLEEFRNRRGYTQAELAEMSGLSRGVIINSENNKPGKLTSLKKAYLIHCKPNADEWINLISQWLVMKKLVPAETRPEDITARIMEDNPPPEDTQRLVQVFESMPINHRILTMTIVNHLKENAAFRAMMNSYLENAGGNSDSRAKD